MMPQRLTLGELDCLLITPPDGRTAALAVLCHGYGAPGDDLVPLAGDILGGADGIALLFPAAPLSLAAEGMPGGRAWWLLDRARLQTGSPFDAEELAQQEPAGSAEAAGRLCTAVNECAERLRLDPQRVVIGGFSQGAMVAADCAFRSGLAWGGLCLLSGAPLRLAAWRREAEALAGRPVLQTHGRLDPILPFAGALAVRNTLSTAGLVVDFRPFIGGHTIPPEALSALPGFLRSSCASD